MPPRLMAMGTVQPRSMLLPTAMVLPTVTVVVTVMALAPPVMGRTNDDTSRFDAMRRGGLCRTGADGQAYFQPSLALSLALFGETSALT
jgi:hypothetical protein